MKLKILHHGLEKATVITIQSVMSYVSFLADRHIITLKFRV